MGMTGLFFGSFNPIHNGHLAIARYLLDEGYCENVWFVVSPQNPWKPEQGLLDERKRLKMVEAAIAGDERMGVSDIEFSMPRPSYTYQTLRVLKESHLVRKFALIMGGDNLQRFHHWKNFQEIIAEYAVFVYPRPGMVLPETAEGNIVLVNAPEMSVSSTEIRRKVADGADITGDVPEAVAGMVKRYYGKK